MYNGADTLNRASHAISVKQNDPSAVQSEVCTPYLGAHLTNDIAALQLKARGRATLNSTGSQVLL